MASPRKFLVLAKIEVTQFTDPVPVAATNAVLVQNLNVSPLKVMTEDRGLIRAFYGNSDQLIVGQEAMMEFDVECAGSGTPLGTAAAYGPLLRACGFAETLTAVTKAEYNPISTAFEYITLYGYRDGVLYKLTGCQGTVKFQFDAKKIPHMSFSFTGKYVTPTDAAIASGAVYTAFKTPVASIPLWMGTVTIGGYAAKVSSLSIDMGNDISHAIWMNQEQIQLMDRKPNGSITVEFVTVAAKDYWTAINAGTTQALVFNHGNVSGNIFGLTAPVMQFTDIQEAEFEKFMALTLKTVFLPSSGNDEIKITLT